ncbi:MAG: hypothetical protein HQM10_06040 [Candidatus Riflebacteria bacterium]|nr:hypothetical protein [Candidatus Riflebacteria bacterium]
MNVNQSDDNYSSESGDGFQILYQDEWYVAIHKPSKWLVHPTKISPEGRRIILPVLRNQLGQRIFPVHRLDCGTSGVIVFALSSEAAGELSAKFEKREVDKTYLAVVRGWLSPTEGSIDRDLAPEPGKSVQKAVTNYSTIAQIELPVAVHPHSTSRYSLLEAKPYTGRRQQIRRHFSGISHPIIGDTSHGDQRHNRVFKEMYQSESLLLMAIEISFIHPFLNRLLIISSPPDLATNTILKKAFRCDNYLDKRFSDAKFVFSN